MGLLGSVKRATGKGDSQKAIKELDKDIQNLARNLHAEKFSSEDQMRKEAEKLIDKHSDGHLSKEEAAFATVWGLSAHTLDYVQKLPDPSEKTFRYYSAAFQSILELSKEYKTAELRASHRPHVIAFALYYLDIDVYRKGNPHRKNWGKRYKKAEEAGNKEDQKKYEEMIEGELQEQMENNLERVETWKEKVDKQVQDREN